MLLVAVEHRGRRRAQVDLQPGLAGIALTEMPPPMRPTDTVVRGAREREAATRRRARAACTAFGTPNAAQLCPPGPANVMRKRREPSARWTTRSSPAPSSAMARARARRVGEVALGAAQVAEPLLAGGGDELDGWRVRSAPPSIASASASMPASPRPLSPMPGPTRRRPRAARAAASRAGRPCRGRAHRHARQGWRYLAAKDAPRDLDRAAPGARKMPEQMRRELRELGLL